MSIDPTIADVAEENRRLWRAVWLLAGHLSELTGKPITSPFRAHDEKTLLPAGLVPDEF